MARQPYGQGCACGVGSYSGGGGYFSLIGDRFMEAGQQALQTVVDKGVDRVVTTTIDRGLAEVERVTDRAADAILGDSNRRNTTPKLPPANEPPTYQNNLPGARGATTPTESGNNTLLIVAGVAAAGALGLALLLRK